MPYKLTRLTEGLPDTVPFVGPETQERAMGRGFVARIGANESVFGPSPAVSAAMAAVDHWKYGDPENHDLRLAIAEHQSVVPEHVVVGEGIDGLLGYVVRLVVGQGDNVVTSDGAYPTFNYHVAGFGGVLHKVPYRDDREDLGALLSKAADVGAKLVYFANPDNPMGTWWSGSEIEARLDQVPDGTLLILDEAYVECAPEGTAPRIDPDDARVLRMRTFSKVYGMAGARLGYAIGCPQLIRAFNKVRNHFGVNRAAQAGGLAALEDETWLAGIQDKIGAAREAIAKVAAENGLTAIPSATNFVALDCGRDAIFAKAVLQSLVDQGLFVRMPFSAPQNRCIRVSCGKPDDIEAFAKALPIALRAARKG